MFDTGHIHPMSVHFPISLILIGFIADLISLIYKKEVCLSKTGLYLMILGTLGAIGAYLSGLIFTPELTGQIGELKETHELFALITTIIMITASVIRVYLVAKKKENSPLKWLVFALFLTANITVGITGFLGGTMVFNFMIGV